MAIEIKSYDTAEAFLRQTQEWMEADEIRHCLPLGVALRVASSAEDPNGLLFKTVHDQHGLALAALMTPPHNLILTGRSEATQEAIDALVDDLQASEDNIPGVLGPSRLARGFACQWQASGEQDFSLNRAERLFELHTVRQPPIPPGYMRVAERADESLVAEWIYQFHLGALSVSNLEMALESAHLRCGNRSLMLWENEKPVSMAGSSRPTRTQIAVGLVYTPTEFRRRGYASAVVAGLSQQLLDAGYQSVTLYTDLANPTSNHIYQEIGFKAVEDFDEYQFRPGVQR